MRMKGVPSLAPIVVFSLLAAFVAAQTPGEGSPVSSQVEQEIRAILVLKEAGIDLTHEGTGRIEERYSFALKSPEIKQHEKGYVEFDTEVEYISSLLVSTRLREAERVDNPPPIPEKVLREATSLIRGRESFDWDRLEMNDVRVVGQRIWALTWEEQHPRGGVLTGGRVGLGYSIKTRKLVSYHTYVARPWATLEKVEITRNEAKRRAQKLALDRGQTVSIVETVLHLSSPLADGGPVWAVVTKSDEDIRRQILIDGRTGQLIRSAEY